MKLFAATLAVCSMAAGAESQQRNPRVAPPDMQAVTPPLAAYTDDVLFGDVWKRTELAPRDRSLVTVAALIAGGHTQQMPGHFNRALDNGVKPSEIAAVITHLAFYAGWPRAVSAIPVARKVFEARAGAPAQSSDTNSGSTILEILRQGSQPTAKGSPDYFIGSVAIDQRFQRDEPARVGGGIVTFEPGARTAWHTHPLGQTLIVTSGTGWVQREGGPVEEIRTGDVVWIPPGVRHWHGATATTPMSHVAIAESLDGKSVDWMEQVPEQQYRRAPR